MNKKPHLQEERGTKSTDSLSHSLNPKLILSLLFGPRLDTINFKLWDPHNLMRKIVMK